MTLRSLGLGLGLGIIVGCSSGAGHDGASSADDEFTIAHGDRFLVSATSSQVVFAKHVGLTRFPYDEQLFAGKAILVNPIPGKADDGVYAHVLGARAEGDTIVVDIAPLSLPEMASITEEQIVRVFVDSHPTQNVANAVMAMASPVSPSLLNAVDAGAPADPFSAGGPFSPLTQPAQTGPTVAYTQRVDRASFTPNVLVDWKRETGLELGFRADIDWQSTSTIGAALSGQIFRSNTWESPAIWLYVPIGVVTVPVRASLSAYIACQATLVSPVQVTLAVGAHASIGGSFRVNPSTSAPTSWVSEGSWPGGATGSLDIQPTFDLALHGTVSCNLPRIELHTKMFGVAGPIVVVLPTAILSDAGFTGQVGFKAGLEAGAFGLGFDVEVPIYTWRL